MCTPNVISALLIRRRREIFTKLKIVKIVHFVTLHRETVTRTQPIAQRIRSRYLSRLRRHFFTHWVRRYIKERRLGTRMNHHNLIILRNAFRGLYLYSTTVKNCKFLLEQYFQRHVGSAFNKWSHMVQSVSRAEYMAMVALADLRKYCFDVILSTARRRKRVKLRAQQNLEKTRRLQKKLLVRWWKYARMMGIKRAAIHSRLLPIKRGIFRVWKKLVIRNRKEEEDPLVITTDMTAVAILQLLWKPGRVPGYVLFQKTNDAPKTKPKKVGFKELEALTRFKPNVDFPGLKTDNPGKMNLSYEMYLARLDIRNEELAMQRLRRISEESNLLHQSSHLYEKSDRLSRRVRSAEFGKRI